MTFWQPFWIFGGHLGFSKKILLVVPPPDHNGCYDVWFLLYVEYFLRKMGTDRQTDIQTDRQTERKRDRQTERKRDRERQRERRVEAEREKGRDRERIDWFFVRQIL